MKIKAQPIIYPDNNICNIDKMYYRADSTLYIKSGCVQPFGSDSKSVVSFNTYFNSFSVGKWKKFTEINAVVLKLKVKGQGIIRVYKSKLELNTSNDSLITSKFFDTETEINEELVFSISDLSIKDTLYFEISLVNSESHFSDAEYWVEIEDANVSDIRLALASCTYKKEKYIHKTLSLIEEYILSKNPDYKIRTYIVDNGGTLDYEICDQYSNLTLIKSENLGASGGFSRALYQSIENDDNYVVSLDDDILLNPHSVNLLYNFLRCIKSEYKDFSVAGAMLIYDKQYLQHDSGAYLEKNRLYGVHSNLDLRSFDNCLINSIQEYHDKTFNGFWFCCYPVSQLREKGLAFPFFMKGDDVELGIRIFNKKLIALNGICTWHESFHKKFTPVYSNIYELRNLLIIYGTQFKDYSALDACKLFVKRALKEIMFYRYEGAELNCKGVELFLSGIDGIVNIDNAEIVRTNQIYKMTDTIDSDYNFSYSKYMKSTAPTKENIIRRLIRGVTFNGNLLPRALLKKKVIVPTVTASIRSVYGYKSIVHYNYDEDQIYVTSNSKIKFFKAIFKVAKTSIVLALKYNAIRREYSEGAKMLTSIDTWTEKFKQSDRS